MTLLAQAMPDVGTMDSLSRFAERNGIGFAIACVTLFVLWLLGKEFKGAILKLHADCAKEREDACKERKDDREAWTQQLVDQQAAHERVFDKFIESFGGKK